MLDQVIFGFSVALSAQNLFYCFVGTVLGTAIGVLPGIGPVATIALLLPVTFGIPPECAIIMLAGIFYGAQYGGSTTSILINLPGELSSVVTGIDGYQMARSGRAGQALAVAAIGSFIAGTVATCVLALSGPFLTALALSFQPADYFSLMLLGLVISSVLTHGSVVKSIAMVVLGIGLGLIGSDVETGAKRLTLGFAELNDGIDFVPLTMGIFGIAEIIRNLERPELRSTITTAIGRLWLDREDWKRVIPSIVRGTALGSFVGILPGGGAAIAAMGAYAIERRFSPNRANFGKGAIEGVAAPESANNAAAQTSFIPLLSLGIPGNAVTALIIGALIVHGVQPGPRMMQEQPALFWGVIASMWIGNVMLLVINLPLIGIWVKLLKVRYEYLYPAIIVFCLVGVYGMNRSVFDVGLVTVFSILGYVLLRLRFEATPLLIGFVLGPMMEEYFRRAMLLSNGDLTTFIDRPISAILLLIAAATLVAMNLSRLRSAKDNALQE